jgi:hypothetical protein
MPPCHRGSEGRAALGEELTSPLVMEFVPLKHEENGCGFTVAPGDGEALTERILALFRRSRSLRRFGGAHPCGLRASVG